MINYRVDTKMRRRVFLRSGAITAGVLSLAAGAIVVTPIAADAAPACATTSPAAVLISPTVCEIRITSSGTYTFPTGIAKLAAVLVGGGGGGEDLQGQFGYAGDGGSVVYVDRVNLGTQVSITVGAGGAGANVAADDGLATTLDDGTVTSAAGGAAAHGAYQGEGAAGPWTMDYVGGPGYQLHDVPGADPSLFPAGLDTQEYGQGGIGYDSSDPASVAPPSGPTVPGTGGYGYIAPPIDDSSAGVDGVVILRFAPQTIVPPTTPVAPVAPISAGPSLAFTGADVLPPLLGGLTLVVAGGVLLALRRRRATGER